MLIPFTVSQSNSNSIYPTLTSQPPDFAGQDTPYQVIPTGTDIPPGATANVSVQNWRGTKLYGYNRCREWMRRKYFESPSFPLRTLSDETCFGKL